MESHKCSSFALATLGLLAPFGINAVLPTAAHAGAGHNHGGGSEEELEKGRSGGVGCLREQPRQRTQTSVILDERSGEETRQGLLLLGEDDG